MLAVMLILLAAAVAAGLSVRYRVPSIPLMIGAGILLGSFGWMGTAEDMQSNLLLGIAFLLFVVGSELDLNTVGKEKRAAVGFGLVQFVLLGGVSIGTAMLLGFGMRASLYFGLAIASSSTLVVVTLLQRRQQFFESFGRLAIGVALFQGVLVILALPVLISENTSDAVTGVVATAGMLGLSWCCATTIIPAVMLRLERDEEALLLVMLAVLFGFLGLAYWLGVPLESGAFLAGLAMSRFPVSGLVRGQLGSLADFFLAVFFVTLGVLFGTIAPQIEPAEVVFNGVLLASILLLAPLLLVPLARRFGLTTRSSIEVTNLLAQTGELSLVVVLLGLDRGHVDETVLGTIVSLTVVTMVVSSLLSSDRATWRIMHWLPGPRHRGVSVEHNGHLVFIGCGTSTRELIRRAVESGEKVVAVDDDSVVVEELSRCGAEAIRGDGADPWLLKSLGLREARLIVSTMRRQQDHERLIRLAGDTPVVVRTFERHAADRLASLGATVISESDEGAAVFLDWFDSRDAAQPGAAGASG